MNIPAAGTTVGRPQGRPSIADGWNLPRNGSSPLSVRVYLGMLVLACLLPAGAIASVTLWSSYTRGRAELILQTQTTARSMTYAVDDAVTRATAGLQALATSPALASGDLGAFAEQARRVLPSLSANNIALTDASGQQRVNTIVPAGRPLPRHGNPGFQQQVLAGGVPRVSDLFIGGALKRPLVVVEVPVPLDGHVTYSIAAGFLPERFASILAEQRPGPDRIVAIFDSTGTIVARTHEADRFVGHKGAPAVLAAMAHTPEGAVETLTLEGVPVIAAYSRSRVAGWYVVIGVPKQILLARLEREVAMVALAMFGLLAFGFFAAGVIARHISGAINALIEPATALGEGLPVRTPAVPIREAAEVAAALEAASALLDTRTRQLDASHRVTDTLRRRAHHLEHLAHHDTLTELANRSSFVQALDAKIEEARSRGGRFTVLFVDIDDFKPINDCHGHAVGDQLLQAFGARLLGGVREHDIVARFGGDEFALLIDDHSPAQVVPMAHGLVDRLSRPYHVRDLTLQVSASIGSAGYPEDGRSVDELMEAADAAMYRAKSGGGRGFAHSGMPPLE